MGNEPETKPKSNRGGPGRGQGRKPAYGGASTETHTMRLTPALKEKLTTLGGTEWIKEQITQAQVYLAPVKASVITPVRKGAPISDSASTREVKQFRSDDGSVIFFPEHLKAGNVAPEDDPLRFLDD